MSGNTSILDVLEDFQYRGMDPYIVASSVRIPGTDISITKGDRIYYDKENNRLIVEPAEKFNNGR